MPALSTVRPLMIMLRALGWAAMPAWPLGGLASVLWSGRVELLLLSVAALGTNSALTLRVLRWSEARSRRRAAEYERLERLLVGAVADLHPGASGQVVRGVPRPRGAARTRPEGIRVVR